MVWPVQCVPVRGSDSLVPAHPDRGFAGFTLANVSFSIPRLTCCCLPMQDCGCALRSGSGPLITVLPNPCQPGGPTLPSFPSFPQRSAQLFLFLSTHLDQSLHLSSVLLHFRPTLKCFMSHFSYVSFCCVLWIIIIVIKERRPL